jgi:RNA polymerase sigma factor (sigma-70 family)
MNDDGDLLRRFAATHDNACFAEIVQRHIGFVYAVSLRRLRDPHSAHDATQAVFIALARKAATVADSPNMMGWLHRSACYETRNLLRAQASRTAREAEAQRLGTVASEPPPDAAALAAVLDDVLHELPERDRDAILARFFGRQSYAEIGAAWRLNENAARMRVDRALGKMREHLQRRGITSTAAALAATLPAYASAAVPAGMASTVTAASILALNAAATGIAAYFTLMSTAKIMTATAAVLIAAGFVYQHQKMADVQSALASVGDERLAATKRIRDLQHQISELKDREAALRRQVSTSAVATAAPAAAAAEAPAPVPGVTPKAPKGWFKNGSAVDAYEVGVDANQTWGGMPSAYAQATGQVEGKFGGMIFNPPPS